MSSRKPTLYNMDEMTVTGDYIGPSERMDRQALEAAIDRVAAAKVSIYSHCAYGGGLSHYETKVGELFHENHSLFGISPDGKKFIQRLGGPGLLPTHFSYKVVSRYRRLIADGIEPIEVYAERCHQRDMKFLACLRMNDRHQIYTDNPCRFLKERPELRMQPWGGMDYGHPQVQDYVAAHIKELAEDYDVDGIELDWMRWVKMFSHDVPVDQRTSVLNDFHRRVRAMLEEIGRKKGRKLLLSVRVPATLAECGPHGYDVVTYCREGLVDILCPTDFILNDPHLPVEQFSELTKGTGILLMPTLHAPAGWNTGWSSTDNLRSLAHSYYAQGADGISVYNWFTPCEYNRPENFQALEEVSDPETLDRLPRAYLFNPMWGESAVHLAEGKHVLQPSQTDRVFPYFARVTRACPGKREAFPIFIKEDLGKVDIRLRLKLEDLTNDDEVVIDVNGRPLDLGCCDTLYVGTGKRAPALHFGPEWISRPYLQFALDGAQGLLRDGGNEIGLTLVKPTPVLDGEITLFEIWVEVRPRH